MTTHLQRGLVNSYHSTKVRNIACIFLTLALIGLNISATMISISIIAAAVFTLLSERLSGVVSCFKANRFLLPLCLLALWLFICVYNNHYNEAKAWHGFKKYVGNWTIFIFTIPLLRAVQYRTWLFNSTVIVTVVAAAVIYTVQHFAPDFFYHSFKYYAIELSFALAFSSFILIQQLADQKKYRVIRGIVLILMLSELCFLNGERSGFLTAIILMVVACFQHFDTKKALLALVGVILLAVGIFFLSPAVHSRITAGVNNIFLYFQHGTLSSWGLRLDFAKHSIGLIKQHPWIGYGTGSFPDAYNTTGGAKLDPSQPLGDPHNTFLHLWVQVGLVGVVLFVTFLVMQFKESFLLPRFERHIAQGLVIAFVFMCLCISGLLRQRLVVFYFIMLITCFGSNPKLIKLPGNGRSRLQDDDNTNI